MNLTSETMITEWLLIIAGGLFLITAYMLIRIYIQLKKYIKKHEPVNIIAPVTWWHLFSNRAIEENQPLEDHEYDGITEYDNNPPAWFNWLFYATILWAAGYLLYFHVLGWGDLPHAEYQKEIAAYEAYIAEHGINRKIDYSTVSVLSEGEQIANGKKIFLNNCAACHGQKGEGGTAPNLTDEYWIHGGEFGEIVKVIVEGVPSMGMIPWEKMLKPQEILEVASFIISLQGSEPENAREPQGEKFLSTGMEAAKR